MAFYGKKKWAFCCPYLKDWQNGDVKWKLPSCIFLVLQITSSLVGFGYFSAWEQTASALSCSGLVLWGPVEIDGSCCSVLCHGPSVKADLWDILPPHHQKRWEVPGVWWDCRRWAVLWHSSAVPQLVILVSSTFANTKHWARSSPFPSAGISIKKCIDIRTCTEAFLHNPVRVCLLWVEGKRLLPKGSRIFDRKNSLHKQGSAWAWSKLAPEEHRCWLILDVLCAKLSI